MANVTATMVKDLREKTGAGMMDCKTALAESDADIEAAIDWLRKKGLSKAANKSGRIAAEGLIAVAVSGGDGVLVEINSETDFVARNDEFQALVRGIAEVALKKGLTDVEALKSAAYHGRSVAEALANAIATIGENLNLRRVAQVHVAEGVVGHYVHNALGEGLGKIGVIVGLESAGKKKEVLAPLARLIALHVAAAAPLAIDSSGLDERLIAREKSVLAEKNAGKPPQVLEKIVESGLKTYYKEVCLLDQPSIHAEHAAKTIGQVVKEAEKSAGAPIVLKAFARYALGEGIEKQDNDA
jgi:elongation factor Ts